MNILTEHQFQRNVDDMFERFHSITNDHESIAEKLEKMKGKYHLGLIDVSSKSKVENLGAKFSHEFSSILRDVRDVYSKINDLSTLHEEHDELKRHYDYDEEAVEKLKEDVGNHLTKTVILHNSLVNQTKDFVKVMWNALDGDTKNLISKMYSKQLWSKPMEYYNKEIKINNF